MIEIEMLVRGAAAAALVFVLARAAIAMRKERDALREDVLRLKGELEVAKGNMFRLRDFYRISDEQMRDAGADSK